MSEELKYTLAISYTKGLGDINTKKIIDFVGSAREAWQLKKQDLLQLKGLGQKTLENFGDNNNLKLAEKELIFNTKNGIESLFYKDSNYPEKLKECADAPPVLFRKGNFNFENQRFISIVGTRKVTEYGKNFIKTLIDDLKDYRITIVSGLAFGCDITAHRQAMQTRLPTIAILAHGLNKIFPKTHTKEGLKMQENGGLISEFSTFHQPEPTNFLKRNRIVAGLCDLTIIVESDFKGGAMSTAKYANNYNREVMALPGRISDKYSNGCNHLITTNQALMIRNAEDLLYHLNLKQKKKTNPQKKLLLTLSNLEQNVVDALIQKNKLHIDELCVLLNRNSYELLPTLLNLELQNIIDPLPGKYFQLK